MEIGVVSQTRHISSDTMSNASSVSYSEYIQYDNLSVLNNEDIDKLSHDYIKEKDVQNAISKLNKFLQGENTHLEYERHEVFKSQFVVKIIDNQTKKVIKEIPPKKILDMVAEICRLAGVIVDKKV
ncbi:flagellar protein FlaG [Clostridium novyi]|uniref:Flagellin family protein n=1 Tax=Clostridium novyi (strain NT) TaxID=386415 RepID=A0PZZ7_CLONN|nr:flagellar protein FlaG [Clostridium novyi]ABK61100.1 flagellin family protein [Clostridium novyi NT]KEH88351.1 hypothetical protein Z966_03600 [Clostridium novyi A str. NCTC 538]